MRADLDPKRDYDTDFQTRGRVDWNRRELLQRMIGRRIDYVHPGVSRFWLGFDDGFGLYFAPVMDVETGATELYWWEED